MEPKQTQTEFERRAFVMDALKVEQRTDKDKETRRIVGHASVFNRDANIGGWFIESVAPGAFKRAIREDDVRALFNHDSNIVLGRNKAGTLKLAEDDVGLAIDIDPPDTQWARDLIVSIERGDIDQMSIGFRVLKQEWDETGDVARRKLLEVELFDVSPVTFPAFVETDVGLRSLEAYRKTLAPKGMTSAAAAPIIQRGLLQRSRERGNFFK